MTSKRSRYGTGTVFKKGDKWIAQISLPDSPLGKRRRRSKTAQTEAGAKKLLKQLIEERDAGNLTEGSDQTLDQFAQWWFKNDAPHQVKAATLGGYMYIYNKYIKPKLGKRKLQDLSTLKIQELMGDLQKMGYKHNTVLAIRRVLHLIVQHAVRHDLLQTNPVSKTSVPKKPYGAETQVKGPFTREEAKTVLEKVKGHRRQEIFTLALSLGMRKEEILGLKWKDVDLEKGEIYIRQCLTESTSPDATGKRRTTLVFGPPKTRNSKRNLKIGSHTQALLKEHKVEQNKTRLAAGEYWENHDLVFANDVGGPLWPTNISTEWKKFLADNQIRHIRFHDIRHTCAHLLLEDGTPVEGIQQTLGHSSIATTKNIYAGYVQALADRGTSDLASILFDEPRTGS